MIDRAVQLAQTLHSECGNADPPGWYELGKVGVDSGTLMVADPCYRDRPDMGVFFTSGFGDGFYRVLGRFEYHVGWGMRLAEVRVVLIENQ